MKKSIAILIVVLICLFKIPLSVNANVVQSDFSGFYLRNNITGTTSSLAQFNNEISFDNTTNADYSIMKNFNNIKGEYLFEVDIKLEKINKFRTLFYLNDANNAELVALMTNDYGKFYHKDGNTILEPEYMPENGEWFNLKIKVNTQTNKHSYYYNYEKGNGEELSFNGDTTGINGIAKLISEVPKGTKTSMRNFKITNIANINTNISSSVYVVDNQYKIISNVPRNTTITDFLSNISASSQLDIISSDTVYLLPNDILSVGGTEFYNINFLDEIFNYPTKEKTNNIFVSNSGSDLNDGKFNSPYKTIAYALNNAQSDTIINLMGGEYVISDTIEITNKYNITIKNFDNQKVKLVGGIHLNENLFSKENNPRINENIRDKVYTYNLDANFDVGNITQVGHEFEVNNSRTQLLSDTEVLTLSRYPNSNYLTTGEIIRQGSDIYDNKGDVGAIFKLLDNRPRTWENTNDVWMNGFWSADFNQHNLEVNNIDKKNSTVEANPVLWNAMKENRRYYFYNILEEVDAKGEWYIDKTKNKLYYYPLKGLEDLYLTTLEMPIFNVLNSNNINIVGLELQGGRNSAIILSGGYNNNISNCKIWGFGINGVEIIGGTNNGVSNSEIKEVGYNGVVFRSNERRGLTKNYNYVKNSSIYDVATKKTSYAYPIDIGGVGNLVLDNHIYNSPHSGIYFHGNDHLIQGNEINNVCRITNDIGAIYSYDNFSWWGTTITKNYIHSITTSAEETREGVMSTGVYLDNFTSGVTVSENIFHNVDWGIFQHGGKSNTYNNNMFIDINPKGETIRVSLCGARPPLYSLNNVPYKSELWKNKYPRMFNIPTEKGSFGNSLTDKPTNGKVYGNIINNSPKITYSGVSVDLWTDEKGTITVTDDFFTNKIKGNFSIYDRTKLNSYNNMLYYDMKNVGALGRWAGILTYDIISELKNVDIIKNGDEYTITGYLNELKGNKEISLRVRNKECIVNLSKTKTLYNNGYITNYKFGEFSFPNYAKSGEYVLELSSDNGFVTLNQTINYTKYEPNLKYENGYLTADNTLVCDIVNTTANIKKVTIYMAVYNNYVLRDVKCMDIILQANEKKTGYRYKPTDFIVADNEILKTYIWETETQMPLGAPITN